MIHPHTCLKTTANKVGLGVFATRTIPRASIVWVLDEIDQKLPLERVRSMSHDAQKILDHYGFLTASGDRILCWDHGRFVNHSCDANVLPTPFGFEIAVREIAAGQEITNDYATLNLERSFACACGTAACRRRVRPSDFERQVDEWDQRVRKTLRVLHDVPQPLWRWLGDGDALQRRIQDPKLTPSLRVNRLEAARLDPLAYAAVPRRIPRVPLHVAEPENAA